MAELVLGVGEEVVQRKAVPLSLIWQLVDLTNFLNSRDLSLPCLHSVLIH